ALISEGACRRPLISDNDSDSSPETSMVSSRPIGPVTCLISGDGAHHPGTPLGGRVGDAPVATSRVMLVTFQIQTPVGAQHGARCAPAPRHAPAAVTQLKPTSTTSTGRRER